MVSEEAPATVNRVGLGFISAYAAAYFGSWIVVLTPVVVTLALRIQQINPAGKAASLSLVLGVGAIFALLANLVFGKLSDRTRSRFGMRRPWLIAGVISGTLGLLVIAFAPNIPLVLVGWCPPSPTENMFNMCMDLIEGRWRNRDVHYGDERVNNWPSAQPQGGCSSTEDHDWSLSE